MEIQIGDENKKTLVEKNVTLTLSKQLLDPKTWIYCEPPFLGIVDIVTPNQIIEVKEFKLFKFAIGQIISYSFDSRFKDKKKTICFFDHQRYSENEKFLVKKICDNHDIDIIWFEDISISTTHKIKHEVIDPKIEIKNKKRKTSIENNYIDKKYSIIINFLIQFVLEYSIQMDENINGKWSLPVIKKLFEKWQKKCFNAILISNVRLSTEIRNIFQINKFVTLRIGKDVSRGFETSISNMKNKLKIYCVNDKLFEEYKIFNL